MLAKNHGPCFLIDEELVQSVCSASWHSTLLGAAGNGAADGCAARIPLLRQLTSLR